MTHETKMAIAFVLLVATALVLEAIDRRSAAFKQVMQSTTESP
jgi:hypothetical protein